MLHSTISQVADAESTTEDFNLSDVKVRLEKILHDIPEVDKDDIPFTLQMITVIQKDDHTYYVDFDSVIKYIKCNDLDVVTTFNQIADEYDISKEDLCLLLPCKDKLSHAFEDYKACPAHKAEKLLKKTGKLVELVENLQKAGIKVAVLD